MLSFQEMIKLLSVYWAKQGCAWHQGYDLEVGAGTFNPVTFLRCLGPEPYKAVYVEPSRRPQDGRYGLNPNRVQYYHQMQVIFKPSPYNIQDLYLGSLEAVGLDLRKHDIRFVHDDWENPTIGASGLGWEVWIDGMEATQFTYFQTVGGLTVKPVTAEITYGLERLAMYLQGVDSIFDIQWTEDLSYGDIYQNSEWQWSYYNFEEANTGMWQRHFVDFETEARRLIEKNLPIPAYDFVMKASHAFNIMDARGSISVSERARIMGKIRALAHDLAKIYILSREEAQFPLLKQENAASPSLQVPSQQREVQIGKKEDFLLEIGSEELPAQAIEGAISHLKELLTALFQKHHITFDEIVDYATPRRLALWVKGLSLGIPAEVVEKKGPKVAAAFDAQGNLTATGEGFFRSIGCQPMTLKEVRSHKDFAIRKIQEQEILFAFVSKESLSTYNLLSRELSSLILSIDFPKKMRWADLSIEYSRPIRWLVALLGNEIVPFAIGPVVSDRITYGHRFLAAASIALKKAQDYENVLEKGYVMASVAKRREAIVEQIEKVEKEHGLYALAKEKLLNEVTQLVEWPTLLFASFDKRFLQAPKEVLISEMVEHQRYFPLEKSDKTLAPHFLAISNNQSSSLIIAGHQKALSPRLADGLFLFEEDLKEPLSHFAQKLERVTFHTELGSMANKQQRMADLALLLHEMTAIGERDLIRPAALLCKADLTTQLVGEFPHLQGIIGATYARHQHQDEKIASAIEEHWLPKQEKGALPVTALGKLLSMADKLDNILSCFALGLKPTASSDPFALRRQAFGLIKIVMEERLPLNLDLLFERGFSLFIQNPELSQEDRMRFLENKSETLREIHLFLEGRVKSLLGQMEFDKKQIEAVLGDSARPYECYRKLQALVGLKELELLVELYRRGKKILQNKRLGTVDEALLQANEERVLFERIVGCEETLEKVKEYDEAFHLLAKLEPVVRAFFDNVIVMTEDLKVQENRLALLQRLVALFEGLLDFSRL